MSTYHLEYGQDAAARAPFLFTQHAHAHAQLVTIFVKMIDDDASLNVSATLSSCLHYCLSPKSITLKPQQFIGSTTLRDVLSIDDLSTLSTHCTTQQISFCTF
uniref:Uncharacterized protein n=1 Tax=Glossina palpalis gambiensis TaxID=67801 RepID=A0A1B0B1S8_9MUSC